VKTRLLRNLTPRKGAVGSGQRVDPKWPSAALGLQDLNRLAA
jgi:hypothetical protein